MLRVSGIDTYYGTSHILHEVSIEVDAGEMVSVLGRNGAGKTTLLRSITGERLPRLGRIEFDGKTISKLASHLRTRRGISYVPQGRQIISDLTVSENLELALLGVGKSRRIPDVVYEYFPALRSLTGRKGGVLSGGQQQQLAIARALVQEPRLLLMDEPTEGLQPSVVAEIQEIIKRIGSEHNCAILLVEQRLDVVRDVARRFAILDTGHIVATGPIGVLSDDVVRKHLQV